MEPTSPHKHIKKKKKVYVEQFSEKMTLKLAEELIQTKLQERSPRNQVGRKKTSEWGQIPWEGSYKRERLYMGRLWFWGAPFACWEVQGQTEGLGCMLACSQ